MAPRTRARILLIGGIAAPACVPAASTDQGAEVNRLYDFFSVVAAAVFIVVVGLIAWSILRYRAKPGDDDLPEQIHANVPLELVWFAIPQAIVIALFVTSALVQDSVNKQSPTPSVTVGVQGFQWGWRFTYEDRDVVIVSTPEKPEQIVLPVGETVAFELSSRDVVHSFYIPRFLMKRDTIPGERNRFDVTIREEGTYGGVCAEFCGLLHHRMDFEIRAIPASRFTAWLDDQRVARAGRDPERRGG